MKKILIQDMVINENYYINKNRNSPLMRYKGEGGFNGITFELLSEDTIGFIRNVDGLYYFSKELTSAVYQLNTFRYGK